jgi:hypothetical protein
LIGSTSLDESRNERKDEDSDDDACRYCEARFESACHGIFNLNPGWIRFGLLPTAERLAEYSACHPPLMWNCDAILDRLSPALTV